MIRALALALALGGCAHEPLRVVVADPSAPGVVDHSDVVEAAGELLGLEVVHVRSKRGAVMVELIDGQRLRFHGRMLLGPSDSRCFRVVRSTSNPVVVAHELGHALGLNHSDDPHNLMYPFADAYTVELTDDQHDTIERAVGRLSRCRNP